MGDQLRAKLVGGFVLVIVFAAGGLVGAAIARPAEGESDVGPGEMALVDDSTGDESGEGERSGEERRDRSRSWFESAGATEDQIEYIRSEILPDHFDRLEALEEDSVVRDIESRVDSIGREWRRAHRELSAYYDPKRDSLMDLTRTEIRAVLDPEAQQVYDSIWNANRRDRDDGRRR